MTETKDRPYGQGDASFQAAGGETGLRQLVDRFYHYMDTLPEAATIRQMHAENLTLSSDKLACFLSGWLGGPRLYKARYGSIIIPQAHKHLDIGEEERDAWLLCMEHALREQDYDPAFKDYLLAQLRVPAEFCRTR